MKNKDDQKAIKKVVSFLQEIFKKKDLSIHVSPILSNRGELILNLKGQTKPLKRQPEVVSALTKLVQLVLSNHSSKRYICVLDLEGHLEGIQEGYFFLDCETVFIDIINYIPYCLAYYTKGNDIFDAFSMLTVYICNVGECSLSL